ncbi:MAG: hypothetical protein P8175_16615 [Deltaproteobacteria bacterium]
MPGFKDPRHGDILGITTMDKQNRPKIEKNVLFIVAAIALLFLGAGAVLGLWSAKEMRELVAGQFNEQQLVIARHASNLIERQMHFLRKELVYLRNEWDSGEFDPEDSERKIQEAFHRVLESGVWKIEMKAERITLRHAASK